MQIVEPKKRQFYNQPFTISEAALILLSTQFSRKSFTAVPNLSVITAALLLDLHFAGQVSIFFCINGKYLDITDSERLALVENFKYSTLGNVLAVLPGSSNKVKGPQQYLFQELVRLTNRQTPVLIVDFIQCVKQTIWINQVLQDCVYEIQQQLNIRGILQESRLLFFFRSFEITEFGQKQILFVQSKARNIVEQTYFVSNDEDFAEYASETNNLNIYFATMIVSAICSNELIKSTKVSHITFGKFENKLKTLLGAIGAIIRTPELKLQPDNIESKYIAIVVSLCAALKQSSVEDIRLL